MIDIHVHDITVTQMSFYVNTRNTGTTQIVDYTLILTNKKRNQVSYRTKLTKLNSVA
jgi:hypothetical protein